VPVNVLGQDGSSVMKNDFWRAKSDLYWNILPEIFEDGRNDRIEGETTTSAGDETTTSAGDVTTKSAETDTTADLSSATIVSSGLLLGLIILVISP